MFDRTLLWQMFLLIPVTQENTTAIPAVYLGCFKDGGDFFLDTERVLEKLLHESDDYNTIEKCIQDCFAAGYKFSGTENGDECWCGNAMMIYDYVPDSECNEPCSGNKEENCGDSWRISIFNITQMHLTTHKQTTDGITSAVNVNQSAFPSTQTTLSSSDKAITSITDESSPQTDAIKTDCGTRKIANGEFIAVSGTTLGQTAIQSCKSGYTFIGDTVVSCTLSGWNATAATCKIVDSGNTSALIAVYVVVSVVATAVCIMLLAIMWRKCIYRGDEKKQAIQGSHNTDTRTINFSNVEALQSNPESTYTDLINPSYVNAIQSQEHEYTSIKTDGNDKRTDEKSVYYNTVEAVISQQ